MTRPTIKRITGTLTRLLYFTMASALVVALLLTLERGLPPGFLSGLASSSQAANLYRIQPGTWETYRASPDGLVSDYVLSIAVEGDKSGSALIGESASSTGRSGPPMVLPTDWCTNM